MSGVKTKPKQPHIVNTRIAANESELEGRNLDKSVKREKIQVMIVMRWTDRFA